MHWAAERTCESLQAGWLTLPKGPACSLYYSRPAGRKKSLFSVLLPPVTAIFCIQQGKSNFRRPKHKEIVLKRQTISTQIPRRVKWRQRSSMPASRVWTSTSRQLTWGSLKSSRLSSSEYEEHQAYTPSFDGHALGVLFYPVNTHLFRLLHKNSITIPPQKFTSWWKPSCCKNGFECLRIYWPGPLSRSRLFYVLHRLYNGMVTDFTPDCLY